MSKKQGQVIAQPIDTMNPSIGQIDYCAQSNFLRRDEINFYSKLRFKKKLIFFNG